MARIINFVDGASSSTTPTIGNIVASDLVNYANDAAYEAAESGAPAAGNIYFNTTDNTIRYYNGTVWQEVIDETTIQTVENKTIDGTSATGNNTVKTDASDVDYDNATSGLTATDTQAAIDEVEGRVEANEGDIDDLETLSGSAGATNHGTFSGSTISDNATTKGALQELETEVEAKIDSSEKGAANGVATLDGTSKIPVAQLPDSALTYEGSFDPTGPTPNLQNGTGNTGDFYRVSADGSHDFGAGSVTLAEGDSVIYNGSTWDHYDESGGANAELSNLGATSINADLEPDVNNTRDLGSLRFWAGIKANLIRATNFLITQGDNNANGAFELYAKTTDTVPSGVSVRSLIRGLLTGSPGSLNKMAMHTANDATADANATGDLHLETGNKTAGTGDSGSVVIYTGTSAGGTRGAIKKQDGTQGTVGHVWTQTASDGSGAWQAATGGSGPLTIQRQVFTSSGSWSKPANLKYIEVEVVGGGGGGGGAASTAVGQAAAGGGGGGGGYSKKLIAEASLASSETVTIGAAGTTGSGAAGGNGGQSSFGAHCLANGGAGGGLGTAASSQQTTSSKSGGSASGGDININGQRAESSWWTGNLTGIQLAIASLGGDSFYGSGGFAEARTTGSGGNGGSATGYGAGGGGAANGTGGNAARTGGAATAGVVIVTEYIQA